MRTFEIHSQDKNGNPDVTVWDFPDQDVTHALVEEFAAQDFWTVLRVIEKGA